MFPEPADSMCAQHWQSSGGFGGKEFPMYVEPLETFMKTTKIETHEALMAPQIQNFWAYLISLIVRLTVMNPRSIENFCFVTAKNKIYSDKTIHTWLSSAMSTQD